MISRESPSPGRQEPGLGFLRSERGHKRADRLMANFEEARRRALAAVGEQEVR